MSAWAIGADTRRTGKVGLHAAQAVTARADTAQATAMRVIATQRA
jgi:hypothetical protein